MESIVRMLFKEEASQFYLKLLGLIGLFGPGLVLIYYLRPSLFFGLDSVKLVLLSMVISVPMIIVMAVSSILANYLFKKKELEDGEVNAKFTQASFLPMGVVMGFVMGRRTEALKHISFTKVYVLLLIGITLGSIMIAVIENRRSILKSLARGYKGLVKFRRRAKSVS